MQRQLLRFKVHYHTVNGFSRLLIKNLTLDPSIVGDRFVDPVAFCHTWVLPQGLAGSTCELSGADAAFGQSAMKNNRPAGLIVPTLDTRFQYPRSHTAATDLKPAASARWVFLLLLSGAVSC